jgi:hypothetical protein
VRGEEREETEGRRKKEGRGEEGAKKEKWVEDGEGRMEDGGREPETREQ